MKTKLFSLLFLSTVIASTSFAQDEEEPTEEKKGFKKENLFTGGSISLAFYNNTFLIGGSPVFGYSITNWADLGLVFNYNYTSYRDVSVFDDRLRQTVYGGGVFTRLFPVRFLFVQGQIERNNTRMKYIPPGGGEPEIDNITGNSILIGGGYTSGRMKDSKQPYYYMAILFDINDDPSSPYTDAYGRTIPIIRAGVHVPLFQGKRN